MRRAIAAELGFEVDAVIRHRKVIRSVAAELMRAGSLSGKEVQRLVQQLPLRSHCRRVADYDTNPCHANDILQCNWFGLASIPDGPHPPHTETGADDERGGCEQATGGGCHCIAPAPGGNDD